MASDDFATQVLADGPVGYWRLAEPPGSATAADASMNRNDGTGSIRRLAGTKNRFLKGFLVLESESELDVVAVYTAAAGEGEVETLHTERVPPRRRKAR